MTDPSPCCGDALYWCPTVEQVECRIHGGFSQCCDATHLHRSIPALVEGILGTRGDTCPECGTPRRLARKFNSGNPTDVWMNECDCADRRMAAMIERRYGPLDESSAGVASDAGVWPVGTRVRVVAAGAESHGMHGTVVAYWPTPACGYPTVDVATDGGATVNVPASAIESSAGASSLQGDAERGAGAANTGAPSPKGDAVVFWNIINQHADQVPGPHGHTITTWLDNVIRPALFGNESSAGGASAREGEGSRREQHGPGVPAEIVTPPADHARQVPGRQKWSDACLHDDHAECEEVCPWCDERCACTCHDAKFRREDKALAEADHAREGGDQ